MSKANSRPPAPLPSAPDSGMPPAARPQTVGDICAALEALAPTRFAEPWDNVGLLVGDSAEPLAPDARVVLTIDLTEQVLGEAHANRTLTAGAAGVLVCYHPPLFSATKRLTAAKPLHAVLLRAIRAGWAVYAPHTALDAAPAGMCDWLADCVLGRTNAEALHADRRALRPAGILADGQQLKVVTFVPAQDAAKVRHALATAGAGRIGDYEVCSFASPGTGTFLGKPGKAHPAVGHAGQLEHVEEHRLEMVVSQRSLALALTTLRQFHPYEEPAIDVYPLAPQPQRNTGTGRRLVLDHPMTVRAMADRLKAALGVSHVQIGGPLDRVVSCIAVCPGSGGELADAALEEGCELLVTGEMKHHEVLAAVNRGLSVLLAGHTRTERPYLRLFASRLAARLEGVPVITAESDRDPLVEV
ncbi:MAG: Nif3-like dinuclear metal center hexameric protein [bacterium]|nr:Nif3-like dinuclear metal center hexameric protein [Phycisphaerales bacterium]MCE2653488.1 Nif3-like dinuclear metal center hexameric protein [Planctomycetaceae bacterium]